MAVADGSEVKGIDIVTYLVQDVERSKAFYRDALGLRVTTEYGPQGAEFVLDDGTTFGIWKMTDNSFRPSGGVMFAVDDIKSAVPKFTSRGVRFDDGGAVEESPVCFMAFASDPDGNTFIVHQRKK